jgi:lipopolysaccharide transport system ATP-binding protein
VGNAAIRIEGLGKRYRLGARGGVQDLRDTLAALAGRLGRRPARGADDDAWLWALRDVSLEIGHGEVVGILGRNGSGKTTLLKVLSRITAPSEGRAEIYGRMDTLLEVGAGFHSELTGRENIYMMAAIHGLKRHEISRRFDQIVAFAELEQFVDTPVKRYSTGMYVRLAFAVAAHLEPDILLVDEVLAVGDLAFQRKCLARMNTVSVEGRTVLFVSHQMNQIRRLCTRCVWLDRGRVRAVGPTAELVSAYERSFSLSAQREAVARETGNGHGTRFLGWELVEPGPTGSHVLETTGSVAVRFVLEVKEPIQDGRHDIILLDADGQVLWGTGVNRLQLEPGVHEIRHELDRLPLRPGAYTWQVSMFDGVVILDRWHAVPDLLIATPPLGHFRDESAGLLNIPHRLVIREDGLAAEGVRAAADRG